MHVSLHLNGQPQLYVQEQSEELKTAFLPKKSPGKDTEGFRRCGYFLQLNLLSPTKKRRDAGAETWVRSLTMRSSAPGATRGPPGDNKLSSYELQRLIMTEDWDQG